MNHQCCLSSMWGYIGNPWGLAPSKIPPSPMLIHSPSLVDWDPSYHWWEIALWPLETTAFSWELPKRYRSYIIEGSSFNHQWVVLQKRVCPLSKFQVWLFGLNFSESYSKKPCTCKIQIISHEVWLAHGIHEANRYVKSLCKSNWVGYMTSITHAWARFLTFISQIVFDPILSVEYTSYIPSRHIPLKMQHLLYVIYHHSGEGWWHITKSPKLTSYG